LDKTFAQLTRQEKNQVSHRGKALHEFCLEFDKVMVWLQQHLAPHTPTGCMGSDL
jgi:XTP/dITP diphosphohydrolase